jgi:hypothetical protein
MQASAAHPRRHKPPNFPGEVRARSDGYARAATATKAQQRALRRSGGRAAREGSGRYTHERLARTGATRALRGALARGAKRQPTQKKRGQLGLRSAGIEHGANGIALGGGRDRVVVHRRRLGRERAQARSTQLLFFAFAARGVDSGAAAPVARGAEIARELRAERFERKKTRFVVAAAKQKPAEKR